MSEKFDSFEENSKPVTVKKEKSAPSSSALTVIIIVLAVLLAAAVALLATFFLKDKFGKKDPTSGDTSDVTSQTSELDEETKALYATEVMTVDGEKIDYETYRYYYLNCKASFDNGDPSYWETEEGKGKLQELKDEVQKELNYEIAAMHMAKENGVEFTEEDEKTLNENISYMDAQYRMYYQVSFAQALSTYNMTLNSYGWLYRYETLVDGLFQKLSDPENGAVDFDEEKVAARAADYYYVKHILYSFDTTSEADALAKAQATLETLKVITNAEELEDKFDELIVSDSADYAEGGANYYFFVDGDMVPEFEEATKALAEGALSEPVKSEYGYHIILRLPIDMEKFKTEVYASECVQNMIQERSEKLTVETTEFFENLTPATAK